MALHLTAVAAKDGTGTTIPGGIHQNDESGVGTGPNDPVLVVIDSTQNEILGTTTGAAVTTDANGSVQQYLRGFVKLLAAAVAGVAGALFVKMTDGAGNLINSTSNALNVFVSNAISPGRNTPANSSPVVLASQAYNTVAASATAQALTGGGGGAAGDWLDFLLIIPASTSPGAVSIKDGTGAAITVFAGGASSVASLVPFAVPIRATSASGAWEVTTGLNVSVIASGNFH